MRHPMLFAAMFGVAATMPTITAAQTDDVREDVVDLAGYSYEDLYAEGMSARSVYEAMDAVDSTGEEIGQVEDMIIDRDGNVIAVIAEVGGFWDIGDTHVSVPFQDVEFTEFGVTLPVSEETINDFTIFNADYLAGAEASGEVVQQIDDAEVAPSFYRLSEVIGDYARVSDNDTFRNYGYVRDAVIREGRVDALIINPDLGYGMTGYRAYPYYGANYGYNPYDRYYDMPYDATEAVDLEEFDYSSFGER